MSGEFTVPNAYQPIHIVILTFAGGRERSWEARLGLANGEIGILDVSVAFC